METTRTFPLNDGRTLPAIGFGTWPLTGEEATRTVLTALEVGLIDATGVLPAVNQVELHPEFSQPALRAFHAARGIVTEAWRPLGKGSALRDPIVESIARKHARTPAQIVLRWEIELGVVAIPKTTSVDRMRENLAVFDFGLDEDDRMRLASLDRGARQGGDPNVHEEL